MCIKRSREARVTTNDRSGIIEETDSPCSEPVVLIKKHDNSLRFCRDFKEFNKVTVFDPRPMPRVNDIFFLRSAKLNS